MRVPRTNDPMVKLRKVWRWTKTVQNRRMIESLEACAISNRHNFAAHLAQRPRRSRSCTLLLFVCGSQLFELVQLPLTSFAGSLVVIPPSSPTRIFGYHFLERTLLHYGKALCTASVSSERRKTGQMDFTATFGSLRNCHVLTAIINI